MNPNIYRLQNGYSPILPGAVHITLKSLRIILKINSEKFVQPISCQFSIFLPPETVGKTKVTLTFSGGTEIKYRHKMGEFSLWFLSYAKLVGQKNSRKCFDVKVGSRRSRIFFKKCVPKNFAIFTGKHFCRSLFLIQLLVCRDRTPLMASSVVFLLNSSSQIFCRINLKSTAIESFLVILYSK